MKYLVTGGAGFIGTNIVIRLKKDGHDVVVLDNYSAGKKEDHMQDGVEYVEGTSPKDDIGTNELEKSSESDAKTLKKHPQIGQAWSQNPSTKTSKNRSRN